MRGVTPTPRGRWRLQAHQRQSRKARIKRTARWYCFIFNTSQFGKIRPRDTPKCWCTPLYVQLARLAEVKQRSQRLLLDDLNTPLPPRQQEDFEALKQVKPFITVSDDERDFSNAQSYFARAEAGRLQVGEVPPGGYHEPIGQFIKEEEEKAYHKMFEHIIGEDGLCVYPHCRKPASEWDWDSAIEASMRYGNCFQSNFEEFEAKRLKLQDEYTWDWLTPRRTLKPEPPVLGSPLPEFPTTKKKKRRQNKAKARATVNQAAPLNNTILKDLHESNLFTTHYNDGLINDDSMFSETDRLSLTRPTVNQAAPLNNTILKDLHESNLFTTHYNDGLINDDSMFSETDRLSLTRPSLSSQVALVPVPGPAQALDLNPDPHLHPLLTFSHILSLPHHPSPPTLPLFSPTPSPLSLHPHPFPSQFSSSCLNPHVHVYDLDEIDDDECGDDYIYY